jgi:hypothetical protein
MRRIFIFCLLWGFAAFASQFGLVTSAEAYCVTNSRDSDRTLYFYTPSHQGDFEKQVAPGKKECCKSGSSGCLAGANDKSIAIVNVSPEDPKYRLETVKAAEERRKSRIWGMKINVKDILDCTTSNMAIRCTNGPNSWKTEKKFVKVPGPQNTAEIKNVMIVGPNDKCLDVQGHGKKDGTEVHLWDCHGKSNQRWNIEKSGRIVGVDSGRCLDIWANGKLTIYGCGKRPQHYWDFAGKSFVSKLSENCLVSTDKNAKNGTKVSVTKCNKKDVAQAWFIADEM